MSSAKRRVLAIALDAAGPALLNHLIEQNEMPSLKSLLAQGQQVRVQSPANIGSGCVWPSFFTGAEPADHGIYGEWRWQPDVMNLVRYGGGMFEPFWKTWCENGLTVGVLDPPFVSPLNPANGFEIIEWGAHDRVAGMEVHPAAIANLIAEIQPHPFATN